MPKILRPLDVYKHLPGTNCAKCGEVNCMAYAAKLIERQARIEDCPPLFEPQYAEKLKALREVLRPPVKEVTIGVGSKAVTIGGKVCVYRHELTWYRPTAIAVDVHDEMPEDELEKKVKLTESFVVERIGMRLGLDIIAVRSVSENPDRFAKTVERLINMTELPLVLCSYDSDVIEEALIVAKDKRPLIYAATENNFKEFGKLASKYNCPLAVHAVDISTLKSLASSLRAYGLDDLVLDSGTFMVSDAFDETVNMFTMIRRAGIEKEDKDMGYPLMAVPASVWLAPEGDDVSTKMKESYLSCSVIARFADLIVLHSVEPWVLLPILVARQCLYTDPRVPLSIKASLYEANSPNEISPLFVTGNSALTYFLVRNDIEAYGKGWLLCVDTGGISLQSSVAGRRFTADMVAQSIKELGLESKIKHKSIILPGYAARISGELEDALPGWKVFVGPRESSDIPKYVVDVWSKEMQLT